MASLLNCISRIMHPLNRGGEAAGRRWLGKSSLESVFEDAPDCPFEPGQVHQIEHVSLPREEVFRYFPQSGDNLL
jgi:hypothetical protein